MSVLPDTTTKGADRRCPLYALALGGEAFLRSENFSGGDDLLPGVRDVTVNAENSLYPPPNVGRLEGPPEAVFVYLSVEELPSGEDMEVRAKGMRWRPASSSWSRSNLGSSLLSGPFGGAEASRRRFIRYNVLRSERYFETSFRSPNREDECASRT
jgi:hypothetical protein